MSQKPTVTISPVLQVAQTRQFIASALPLTMKLAWSRRAVVTPLLRNSPERWPYHDRVLAWLAPRHLEGIVRFHDLGGLSLTDLRSAEELARLDVHYCTRLAKAIEGRPPAWTDVRES